MEVDIPLTNKVYKTVDGAILTDESAELIDGYVLDKNEQDKATVGRPPLVTLIDFLGTGRVDGIYWWDIKGVAIVVAGGRIYKVSKVGTVYSWVDLTGTTLTAGNRVSFATDGTNLFLAAGGAILSTDGTTTTAALADAQAPTAVTSLTWLDGYLIANNNNNSFYFSEVNNATSFVSTDFASASRDPDKIAEIKLRNRELLLFGRESIEIWENDGVTPFSNIAGGTYRVGSISPKSVISIEDRIFFLSNRRRFHVIEGSSSPQRISTEYETELDSYSDVSDCLGDYAEVDGVPLLLFSFPTANKTLCYQMRDKSWSSWGSFDTSDGEYDRWVGNVTCYIPNWGVTLVGHRSSTKLCRLASQNVYDGTDSVRMVRRTGHINYGTLKGKRSNKIYLIAKRGDTTAVTNPRLMFRYRNNNNGTWSNERHISLGAIGDSQHIVQINRTGIFRSRQYEFAISDNVSKIFLEGKEEIDLLTR